jgi:hypothetical protein
MSIQTAWIRFFSMSRPKRSFASSRVGTATLTVSAPRPCVTARSRKGTSSLGCGLKLAQPAAASRSARTRARAARRDRVPASDADRMTWLIMAAEYDDGVLSEQEDFPSPRQQTREGRHRARAAVRGADPPGQECGQAAALGRRAFRGLRLRRGARGLRCGFRLLGKLEWPRPTDLGSRGAMVERWRRAQPTGCARQE